MKYWNGKCKFAMIIALMAVCGAVFAATNPPIVEKCKTDLAKRTKIPAKEIKVVAATPVVWPDASLGMPEIGKSYAFVQTPGYRITLEARGFKYLYVASAKTFRYGGPLDAWMVSMLYTVPIPNEANLNGDLYQASILGTNPVRIATGVENYWPQENGSVIIERRTSRSGQQLLYVRANAPMRETLLYAGFAAGPAAVNRFGNKWAAVVRRGLGSGWNVAVGKVGGKGEDVRLLPMPNDLRPSRIAWSDDSVMLMMTSDRVQRAYEIAPSAENAEWKEISSSLFPGAMDFVLNKSESLDVSEEQVDGKPVVEVATVWFTGDRNVLARIMGLSLRGAEMTGYGYVFLTGEQNGKTAAYTVDISNGEVFTSLRGGGNDPKAFRYRPIRTPMIAGKAK